MKPQTRKKAATPNSATAGITMPASEKIVPKKESGMSSIAEHKPRARSMEGGKWVSKPLRVYKEDQYIKTGCDARGNSSLCMMKTTRGKHCHFACSRHLKIRKARLLAKKVAELSETTQA